ncbi:MAG: HD domain-containing protein [Bacteroidota bacterium]
MEYLSLDLLIVIAFLLISLGIGLKAGRGIKDIRDYALANRSYSAFALVLTYLATEMGGRSILGDPKEVFTSGIIVTIMTIGLGISAFLRAIFIAPHMHHFKDCLTLGDMVSSLYGPSSKFIAGSMGTLYSIAIAGMQLSALGLVVENLLGIPSLWGVIAGGLVLTVYSAMGGIKAVTATDIFQFLILFAVIPLVAAIALDQAGGFLKVVETVPADRFKIGPEALSSSYFTLFIVYALFMPMVDPAFVQRMLMAKDGRQLRNMLLNVAAFSASFRLIVMILALAGLSLYPHITPDTVVTHIINELLPIGIKGVAIAGMLAIIMSTADSHLHAAGLTLAHDVLKPISRRYQRSINELYWAQYATLLMGLGAIWVGLNHSNLLRLSFQASSFIVFVLAVPLISGIMGLKPSKKAFYTAMLATVGVFVLAKLSLPDRLQPLTTLISLFTNAFVFLLVHLVENQGFVLAERSEEASLRTSWPIRLPRSLWEYSRQKVTQYGAPYMLFGIFCCINFTLPYFMWLSRTPAHYDIVPYLRLLGATMGGLLIVREKWPHALLPYFPAFWHFTLLYCIPFTSTLMLLLTQGHVEWLVNLTVTVVFLIVLVDWLTFFILTALGVGLGVLFYRLAIGPIVLNLDLTSGYLLVYQGIFATAIGLLFARRKEQRTAQAYSLLKGQSETYQASLLQIAAEKQATLQALQNTGVSELLTIAKDLRGLGVKKSDLGKLEALESKLIPMAFQLQSIDSRSRDYLRLQIADMSLEALLDAAQAKLQAKGVYSLTTIQKATKQTTLNGDLEKLATLLAGSILSWHEAGTQDDEEPFAISIHIDDTQLSYPLPDVEEGYIKYVPALRIVLTTHADQVPRLALSYAADLNAAASSQSETSEALEQLANSRIAKAHYGYVNVSPHTLVYVVPVNLEAARPKDMDKSYMALDYAPERANDRFKNGEIDAKAQEEAFLATVEERSPADLGLIKNALELIKWYHGPSKRYSGEPFYLHPMAVAQIVLDYNQEEATIIGALLHDTVEDTQMLLQHIETVFGKETAEVVDLVTHLQSMEGSLYKVKLSAEENIRMLERTGNTRGLYVKLADRMHNVRTIHGHSTVEKRKLIAQETMDFFVPLAERMGLQEAATELKERCLAVLNHR